MRCYLQGSIEMQARRRSGSKVGVVTLSEYGPICTIYQRPKPLKFLTATYVGFDKSCQGWLNVATLCDIHIPAAKWLEPVPPGKYGFVTHFNAAFKKTHPTDFETMAKGHMSSHKANNFRRRFEIVGRDRVWLSWPPRRYCHMDAPLKRSAISRANLT